MKKSLLIVLLLLITIVHYCYSQHEAYNWYFGQYGAITFNTPDGNPIALNDCKNDNSHPSVTISDLNKGLLFYSDGRHIWGKDHNELKNAFGFNGMYESSLII